MPEAVVDVLEAVDVDEQSACQHAWLACHPREHLLGAVEHEGAIRQPGQRVVESLMGELAGLLAHERKRSPASGAEDQHQQAKHHAQEGSADQQHE